MIYDPLTPTERVREFEDLEKCIRMIRKNMMSRPSVFRSRGIEMCDEETDFTLKMFVDGNGVYGLKISKGVQEGLTFEQLIVETKKHYLESHNGYEQLVNAVRSLGIPKTYDLGDEVLLITTDSAKLVKKNVFA